MKNESYVVSGAAGVPATSSAPNSFSGATSTAPLDTVSIQQYAEQLRQLAQQIENFLQRQVDRVERQIASPSGSDDPELEALVEEVQQARQKWEQERLHERHLLQEDAQRLAEAWQRLEDEQRELLKHRASFKTSSGLTQTLSLPSTGPLQPARAEGRAAAAAPFNPDPTSSAVANRNQLQFQQLRREMLEHARQRRKG
jgi:hypothetical protein